MSSLTRWSVTLIAVIGLVVCTAVVGGFLTTIVNNELPWSEGVSSSTYYLVVGSAYSRGFVVGFFFSFFLVLLAVVAAAWFEARRARRNEADRMPAAGDAGGKVVAYRR
jgi:cbb3-type cytochrome oxidase subunit 3